MIEVVRAAAELQAACEAEGWRFSQGGPNPFIDPAGCRAELDLSETMFRAVLAAQRAAP